eukprot:TRINITY_DN7006_c0_g1_i1.p1 TRINITY_DN7006_c0_g1~~TRINITY_DN7006_c0_g1_i1.p1  ORF type:complete len:220 (-),score=29.03 TRINITY_DN7006_c0_g1_i1:339-998(-)
MSNAVELAAHATWSMFLGQKGPAVIGVFSMISIFSVMGLHSATRQLEAPELSNYMSTKLALAMLWLVSRALETLGFIGVVGGILMVSLSKTMADDMGRAMDEAWQAQDANPHPNFFAQCCAKICSAILASLLTLLMFAVSITMALMAAAAASFAGFSVSSAIPGLQFENLRSVLQTVGLLVLMCTVSTESNKAAVSSISTPTLKESLLRAPEQHIARPM